MSAVTLIARDEVRLMRRNRVAVIACALLVLLTFVAVASSWAHKRGIEDLRARHQHEAEQVFDAQPATAIRTAWCITAPSSSVR